MATKTKKSKLETPKATDVLEAPSAAPLAPPVDLSAKEAELDAKMARLDAMEKALEEKLEILEAQALVGPAPQDEPEELYDPETPLPEEMKLWRFATNRPFTRVVKPSMIIADQVVQGQAIRTSTIPALRIEFNKETLTYQTSNPEEAAEIMKDSMFRSKRRPAGRYWLVEGFPKAIGTPMTDDPIHGPQPMVSNPSRVVSGARGTSRRV